MTRGRAMPAVLCAGGLGFSGYFMMLALAPAMASVHGGDVAAGTVTTTFMLATVATQMSMSRLLRVHTPESLLRMSLVLLGLPTLAYLLPNMLFLALTAAALRGIGFGIITIMTTALVSIYASEGERGAALGLYGFMTSAAGVVFPALSVFMLGRSQDYISVVVAAALPLAGLAFLKPIKEASPSPVLTAGAHSSGLRSACANWGILLPVLIFLPSAIAYGGLFTFLPRSSSIPTASLLFFGGGFAIGRYLGGRLSDRFRTAQLVVLCTLLALLGVLATAINPDGIGAAVFPLFAGLGVGSTATTSLMMVMRALEPGEDGLGSTIWNVFFDIGIAIGGIGLGLVSSNSGYTLAYSAISVLMGFSMLLGLLGSRSLLPRSGERFARPD